MSAPVIDLSRRLVAISERDRLAGFLSAVGAAADARSNSQAYENESRATTGVIEATISRLAAENRLLELSCDPGLAVFLGLVLEQLNAIAGEAA